MHPDIYIVEGQILTLKESEVNVMGAMNKKSIRHYLPP